MRLSGKSGEARAVFLTGWCARPVLLIVAALVAMRRNATRHLPGQYLSWFEGLLARPEAQLAAKLDEALGLFGGIELHAALIEVGGEACFLE
ncbi:hypothetical protein SAMN07250955_103308 [Arboricoccus pini]|uniref:Uncharacterized protein n=1 Tax=Arboricoccus pini TaxID=1963835 RepID=A0A212QUE6_9PROT|nr:hypothetical protein SAMN07250955_103308 [Arboricoccus pini]